MPRNTKIQVSNDEENWSDVYVYIPIAKVEMRT